MTAFLLHTELSCFMFPFCGHDWGSRFNALLDAHPHLDGMIYSCSIPEMLNDHYDAVREIMDDIIRELEWIESDYISE